MSNSIFVQGDLESEHEEYGTFVFKEPNPEEMMMIPQCFNADMQSLMNQADGDGGDPDEIEIDFNPSDINFDKVYELLERVLVEWPEDREINQENLRDLKFEPLMWVLSEGITIMQEEGTISEDEAKNSNTS